MNEHVFHRILLIEPSYIIRTGFASLIEESKKYKIISSLPDLTYYNSSYNNRYDLILINPIVINYDQRMAVRTLLSISTKPLLFAIIYSGVEEYIMHQYDGMIYITDSKETILKKLNDAIDNTKDIFINDNKELSLRERSILTEVALGKTNKEIAETFNLSVFTVATHRKNISNKLGITSISGLTVYAILNKLIDMSDFK